MSIPYLKVIIISISFSLCFSKTPPHAYAEDNSKFRFAVMGCMHLGVCGSDDFELAIEKIKGYKPDFVLLLGGMIDALGEKSIESLWYEFDRLINKLGVPTYNLPGNCKVMPLPVSRDRAALMEKCFLDRHKKRYYSFTYRNNLFIALDSDSLLSQKKNGLITSNQLEFLNKTIADASKYANVFIILHRSLWFQDEGNEWFKFIHPLIRDKVKFVFGADTHYLDAKKVDKVTYITSGTPPCYLKSYPAKSSFFHFLIVDVDKNKTTIKIVPIKPFLFENLGTSLTKEELSSLTAESTAKQHQVIKPYILTAYEREVFLNPNRVIEALKIKPGMNILDIGAGTGFFTFRFADALKGTGKVFATDTAFEMVHYIKKKAEENNYKNIFPVCVKPQATDPFYREHAFDLIFVSETYHYLRQPEDYFQHLRPSLAKGGRLYIIHPKNVFDFSEIEFDDFKKVIQALASEGKSYPVFQKLSKETRDFIKNWQGGSIPSDIRMNITRDFNKMLLDRSLLYELLDYYAAKNIITTEGQWSAPLMLIVSSEDLRLAKWLFIHLEADGVFKKKRDLTNDDKEQLRKLNRILLKRISGIKKMVDFQGEAPPSIYIEKNSLISTLEAAGYQLEREYDFLVYHYFLEFKRKF